MITAMAIVVGKCINASRNAFLQSAPSVLAKVAITGNMYKVKLSAESEPHRKIKQHMCSVSFCMEQKADIQDDQAPAARISSHMISDCLKFSLKALKNVFVVPVVIPFYCTHHAVIKGQLVTDPMVITGMQQRIKEDWTDHDVTQLVEKYMDDIIFI